MCALTAALLGAIACDPSNDRPSFGPLYGATIDTIAADPATVIEALAQVIDSIGIPTRSQSARDGYLDTRGYDVYNARPRGRDTYNPEHVVVFRFWADLIPGERSRVTGEATYRQTLDPSLAPRLADAVTTPRHPGHDLLLAILEAAKNRTGG